MAKTRGKGEGAVYQRPDGKYEGSVEAGKTPTGKRRRIRVVRRTKREVRDALDELRRNVAMGVRPNKTWTVGQFLDWWVVNVAPETTKESTAEDYAYVIGQYIKPYIGTIRLDLLTVSDVQRWQNTLKKVKRDDGKVGYSASTRAYGRRVLRRALGFAERELVPRNVAALTDGPALDDAKLDDALDIDEAKLVLKAADGDRLEALAVIVLYLGLRKGEALALRWHDIDLDTGLLTIRGTLKRGRWKHGCAAVAACAEPRHTKKCKVGCAGHARHCPQRHGGGLYVDTPKSKKSGRVIPLVGVGPVIDALKAHRRRQVEERLVLGELWQDTGHVFTSPIGTPVDPRNVNRWWDDLVENKAKVDHTRVHASRHTCGTLLRQAGVPLDVIRDILGHSSVAITEIYAKVDQVEMHQGLKALGNALDA